MQVTFEDIREFLHVSLRIPKESIREESDIQQDFGIDGDDWDPLLEAYRGKFQVNLDEFLWYFHYGEEGINPLWLIFKPPFMQVQRIPITPRIMLESARLGFWSIKYPSHKISKRRYDALFLWWIGIAALLLGACVSIYKITSK